MTDVPVADINGHDFGIQIYSIHCDQMHLSANELVHYSDLVEENQLLLMLNIVGVFSDNEISFAFYSSHRPGDFKDVTRTRILVSLTAVAAIILSFEPFVLMLQHLIRCWGRSCSRMEPYNSPIEHNPGYRFELV